MNSDIDNQLKEAFSDLNKYYCSQYYGKEIKDKEILLRYYIKHGGARDYRNKHMSKIPQPLPRNADGTIKEAGPTPPPPPPKKQDTKIIIIEK